MSSDLQALTRAVVDFSVRRGWGSFHNPKNLLLAVVGEVGELAAELQWLTEEEAQNLTPEQHQRVAAEIADVQIYLLQLCNSLGIDVGEAVVEKMAVNEERWPLTP